MLTLALLAPAALAQAPAGLDPRLLEQLQGQLGAGAPGSANPSRQLDEAREDGAQAPVEIRPRETAEEIAVRRARARGELVDATPASPIEREYQARTGDPTLRQFGYDLFQTGATAQGPLTGAVGGDYTLGIGDELVVSFQGATNDSRTARVDREGRVVVGQLPPIRAAGRSLGAVRAEIAAATRRTLLGTTVDISVGAVRAITVFVGGEVASPGQYQLTSLGDVAGALAQAGGIRRSGSLRAVRLVRAGRVQTVDLYGLLGLGAPPVTRLRDGDRIIVPVIGQTAAVAGGVARPGIFELRGRTSVGELIAYAGGGVRPRGSTIAISRIAADGSEEFVRGGGAGALAQAGDAVQVIGGSAGGAIGRVLLRGFVLNPGPRPLTLTPTVRDLVGDVRDLRAGTYLPLAVIVRRDPATGSRRFLAVDLGQTLRGGAPVPLRSEDRLYVLGQTDAEFINRAEVRQIALGRPNTRPGCRALERLEELVRDTQSQRYAVITRGTFTTTTGEVGAVGATLAQRSTVATDSRVGAARDAQTSGAVGSAARPTDSAGNDITCPSVFQEEPELLAVIIENSVSVGGAVRRPGAYPVAGAVAAQTLETLAEGLLGQSGDVVLDVTRARGAAVRQERFVATDIGARTVTLQAGDDIRFNAAQAQFEPGAVLLTGEVARPGLFTIKKGERLSELLVRAGGVTSLAYPYGAVFTRRAVREAQQEGFRRTARELNEGLLTLAARRSGSRDGGGDSLIAAGQFVQTLATLEAPGRVVIEADPRVLALRPDLDVVLEAGDALYLPKQPTYVLALGDLANPGALQFIPGKTVQEYLRESGGARRSADDDRAFVVLPNGSAQPIRSSHWRRVSIAPPPGSTIVVPKNIDPLYKLDVFRDITSIVGQFVSSIATVAILATN